MGQESTLATDNAFLVKLGLSARARLGRGSLFTCSKRKERSVPQVTTVRLVLLRQPSVLRELSGLLAKERASMTVFRAPRELTTSKKAKTRAQSAVEELRVTPIDSAAPVSVALGRGRSRPRNASARRIILSQTPLKPSRLLPTP